MPYVHHLQARFGDAGLRILGIHAPELEWEKDLDRYAKAKKDLRIAFPSYFDRDFSYSLALGSSAWPVITVIDRKARVRGEWIGEVHAGTFRADAIEALIEDLLAE